MFAGLHDRNELFTRVGVAGDCVDLSTYFFLYTFWSKKGTREGGMCLMMPNTYVVVDRLSMDAF